MLSDNSCVDYLATNSSVVQRTSLGLNHQNLSQALRHLLKFKAHKFQNLNLSEISKYLSLNDVQHTVLDGHILILPQGSSVLNRFAQRLSSVSQRRDLVSPTGVTQLIFDPKSIDKTSFGVFEFHQKFDEQTSELLEVRNQIFLSFEAILQLRPTFTEFHELIHWKAYFQRSSLNVSSVVQGHVDIGGPQVRDVSVPTNQDQNFSLEELQAHLLTLSKNIRLYNQSEDPDLSEDLAFMITQDISSLYYYASMAKPLVEDFFKKSIFNKLRIAESSAYDESGLSLNSDILEVVNFDWLEQISNYPGQGERFKERVLEYQFSNYQNFSWIYLMIPVPESFRNIHDYRRLKLPENQKAYNDLANSVYYKMRYLLELIEFIEDLSQRINNDEIITESPIQHFHTLNRQLKSRLENL